MSLEDIGYGVGTSIFGTICIALGFKRRLDKLEDNSVTQGHCKLCKSSLDEKFLDIKEDLKYIRDRLDRIV